MKPEVFFFGQIVGAEGFNVSDDDGLFCEMIIDIDKSWGILSSPKLF
jgi:hypothetical protein